MLAFTVKRSTGHPDPDSEPQQDETREHSTVIIAYDSVTDKVTLAHWGKYYSVNIVDLYLSAQALLPTRNTEYYNKNRDYKSGNQGNIAKYIATNGPGERQSIEPTTYSGFQSKLLIVKKPIKKDLLKQRASPMTSISRQQPSLFHMGSSSDGDVTAYSGPSQDPGATLGQKG